MNQIKNKNKIKIKISTLINNKQTKFNWTFNCVQDSHESNSQL